MAQGSLKQCASLLGLKAEDSVQLTTKLIPAYEEGKQQVDAILIGVGPAGVDPPKPPGLYKASHGI